MSNPIFQLLIFLLVFYFEFYAFGLFLLSKLKVNIKTTESFVVSIVLSFSFISSALFFGGYILDTKIYYLSYLFLFIGIINYKKTFLHSRNLIKSIKTNKFYFFTILFFSIIYASTLFLSGLKVNNQIIFQEFHDSIWHLALINRLKTSLPPTHPSSFLFNLKNYHYFYDLILASISRSFSINISLLYFQIFIPLISLLLGFSSFVFIKKITKNKKLGLLMVFITFFTGSFSYLIPIFLPNNSWGESSFWVSQTFGTLVNPQLIYSFSILFSILILLFSEQVALKQITHFIISFLIASSMGFKSYAFLVYASLYCFYLIIDFVRFRRFQNIKLFLILFFVSLPFYLLLSSDQGFPFFYEPLWFINTMVEAPDRLNVIEWKLKEATYLWLKAYHQVIWLKFKEILIFFIGNLGIRFIFIFSLIRLFKSKHKLILPIFFTALIFSLFPLFFLQRGVVWNSIQFWYYVLIFANILLVLSFNQIYKLKNKFPKIILTFIVVILSLPTFVKYYYGKITSFDKIEISKINFLQNLSSNQIVLVCPSKDKTYDTSFLTAYTNVRTYLTDPNQLDIIYIDSKEKESALRLLLQNKNLAETNQFLARNQINYIVCGQRDEFKFIKSLNDNEVLENQDVLIKRIN